MSGSIRDQGLIFGAKSRVSRLLVIYIYIYIYIIVLDTIV